MIKKLPIIREMFKGDHNAAVVAARKQAAKTNNHPFQGHLIKMYFPCNSNFNLGRSWVAFWGGILFVGDSKFSNVSHFYIATLCFHRY